MTDRELLEYAAKAANIGPLDFDYEEREGTHFYFGPRLPMPQGVLMAAMHTYWNPLEDDGDALRLAVKLRLNILFNGGFHSVNADRFVMDICQIGGIEDIRHAIVRAAAEIGRNMK